MLLQQRLMGIALAGSLLIHAVCALLIPAFSNSPSLEPVETVSFARVRRIQIVRHNIAARRAVPQPTRVAHVPLVAKGPGKLHFPPTRLAVAQRTATLAMNHSVQGDPASGAAVGAATQSSPQPQATAPPAIHQENAPDSQEVAGGYMPFGADEPDPVLDPKALKQLQALGLHVTLTVTVGDDGKTKSVDFHPPLDPALEAQVRALLGAANWDPAYCGGGVPCQKDTSITL